MASLSARIRGWQNKKSILIGILVFGSIWGLFDAVSVGVLFSGVGPLLNQSKVCICPLTGAIVGFFIMAFALAIYKKPAMLIGIGIVAAAFKLLNFAIVTLPIVKGSVVYQPVVNPALSAFVQSIVFALVAALLLKGLEGRSLLRVGIAAGALAGFLGVVAFVYAAFYVTQTHPLIVNTPWQFIFPLHGPAATGLGAIFLPLGYWAGVKSRQWAVSLPARQPRFYYAGSAVAVALCLGLSAVALL